MDDYCTSFGQPGFPTDYNSIVDRIMKINPVEYGRSRNFVDGAITYLSPYISRGVVSTKQIKEKVIGAGGTPVETTKLFQELAWREFFQRVWQAKGDGIFNDLRHRQIDVSHHGMIQSILNAATGIRVIDQAIKTFYNTGYLHNHVRMYIACIACNLGKANWLAPARWMYAHLLDGDLASNMCSWQWVAGTFSNKKYYCTQENINHFTRSLQHETFLDQPIEMLASAPIPVALNGWVDWSMQTELPSCPQPSIDPTLPTLIYNSYNLDPLWRKDERVNRVLLLEPSHFCRFPVSSKVIRFILDLTKNITGIQLMVGEVRDVQKLYVRPESPDMIISKEHPAFRHYPGLKDERDWMFPSVQGYFPSFSSYWKQCSQLRKV